MEPVQGSKQVVDLVFLMQVDTQRAQARHALQGVHGALDVLERVPIQVELDHLLKRGQICGQAPELVVGQVESPELSEAGKQLH